MMDANQLHVVTVRSNPLGWKQPERVYRQWTQHMLDSGVQLTVVEVAYGEKPFACALPHVNHVGLRARTWCWSKENALNIGIQRLPHAEYFDWHDSDVFHRDADWARKTVDALQTYDVVQPWSDALDMGPGDELIQTHKSFCSLYHKGLPVTPAGSGKFWRYDGGPYDYAHSGYAWATTRRALDAVGGLFEVGGMGSGDHHMALALVGKAEWSLPGGCSAPYREALMRWQRRAVQHVNFNVGYVPGVIEHRFHGRKADRGYLSRWSMFVRHGFDPDEDLKRNSFGVFEWSGNKPELRREFDLYLRSRNEDINAL